MGVERALAFFALALLAEVAGTVGGFGSSVFFVPVASLFLDFESVLGLTALFHLASNISKLGLFRGGIDRALLLRLGVPSVVFALLGGLASAALPVRALQLVLAVFLVVLAGWWLLNPAHRLAPTPRMAAAAGALSGGMAGLVGTGGAVRGLALAAFALPKEVFVATSAAIDLGIDLARAGAYFANGFVHVHDLVYLPMLAVVAIAGSWLGRLLLRRIPQERFRQIALWLVLGIGLMTLVQAWRGGSPPL